MCDSSDLSELSREELYSMINQMKENENQMKEDLLNRSLENSLLKTELNKYKNKSNKCQSKKRKKSSGSEALDRQTVNKKLCLRSNLEKSQSFSDRICDDLCEEILQYLSLEDKLKLEGVSKQFQRTVLKKHYELTIETDNCIPNRKVKEEYKYLYIENKYITLKSLEVLLKKCPNITSIELSEVDGICDYNPVFRLITKYCNNLREIDFEGNEINNKNLKAFQRKLGQNIKYFDRLKDAKKFNLFPNIEKLKVFGSELELVYPHLKLKQLTDLTVILFDGQDHLVKTCVDTFPKLKHFRLHIWSQNSDSIYSSLHYISKLKHLIELSFRGFTENKLFCDSLKVMLKKCRKLKRIKCEFKIISNKSDIRQLLSPFEALPTLKRLYLSIQGRFHVLHDKKIFSFEAIKGLSNITHLTLEFDFVILKEMSLKDIDNNLPNLQYLVIDNYFSLNQKEVTQLADILSRLSKLKTLKLRIDSELNENEIEVIFREKCQKLQTFENLKF